MLLAPSCISYMLVLFKVNTKTAAVRTQLYHTSFHYTCRKARALPCLLWNNRRPIILVYKTSPSSHLEHVQKSYISPAKYLAHSKCFIIHSTYIPACPVCLCHLNFPPFLKLHSRRIALDRNKCKMNVTCAAHEGWFQKALSPCCARLSILTGGRHHRC